MDFELCGLSVVVGRGGARSLELATGRQTLHFVVRRGIVGAEIPSGYHSDGGEDVRLSPWASFERPLDGAREQEAAVS